MPGGSRPRLRPPELPAVPGGLLDWRSGHWSDVRAQCRYCPQTTHLRDHEGRPAHKTCAEEAARRWSEEMTQRHERQGR